jgi:hypothetical protein
MGNAMLVTHRPNEIAATTLFLFQIAMLEALVSSCRCILEEEKGRKERTYTRSTINSEAATKAR